MGRKAFEPTKEQRSQVEKLCLVGIDQRLIAEILEINKTTLIKYFKKELRLSKVKRIANVGGSLYNSAMNGNVTASIFIMKTQAGWREKDRDPLDEDKPIPLEFRVTGRGERIAKPKADDDE